MDERALRRAIDRIEILDLMGRYCLTLDSQDIDGWVRCFTDDGMFGGGDRAVVGRDNIRAYAEIHVKFGARHITSSPVHHVADDGLSATGKASTAVTVATRHGFKVVMTGSYRDLLKKVEGTWLIAERFVDFQTMPDDPGFVVPLGDPDVAGMHEMLMDAFHRYSQPVPPRAAI